MDKEKAAISRIQFASAASLEIYGKPIVVAYSGGKDSDTLLEVVKRAKVPFVLDHSHTTADAPPTVYHAREVIHQLECEGVQCNVHYPQYKKQRTTLWAVIPEKGMPPTRIQRYCCSILKQTGKRESIVLTGVRWDESTRRKKTRGIFEKNAVKIENRIVLREDDDDIRRQYIDIMRKTKVVTINPIVDWSNRELWDYVGAEKITMNPLYEMGFSRVGCVGCPLAGKKRWFEFRMFPAYEMSYRRAFAKMLEVRRERRPQAMTNRPDDWQTADDVFRWWMEEKTVPGQIGFSDLQVSGESSHDSTLGEVCK